MILLLLTLESLIFTEPVLARLLIPVAVVELPLLFDLLMILLLVTVDLAITLDDITAAIAIQRQ
jgi:hypothetical protein